MRIKPILLQLLLSLQPATVFADDAPRWEVPEAISTVIENYPSCYRRVYYYYDHENETEYNRIQFSSERKNLKDDEIKALQNYYDSLYAKTLASVRSGNDYELSQYVSRDSISTTVKAAVTGAFDLGSTTLDIDLGCKLKKDHGAVTPDFHKLEASIKRALDVGNAKETKVKYTGLKAGILYVFQRGHGKGWTTGTRYTIKNASRDDFEMIRKEIVSFIGSKKAVTVFDRTWQTMVKSETTPSFYAVGYDPSTKTLNILKATIENEICIPYDWQTRDYLTN